MIVREISYSDLENKRYSPKTGVACVASISVRFRSKERERESKWRKQKSEEGVGNKGRKPSFPYSPPSFIYWCSFHFSRGKSRESRSLVFLCSKTKRKRSLCRLKLGSPRLSGRVGNTGWGHKLVKCSYFVELCLL